MNPLGTWFLSESVLLIGCSEGRRLKRGVLNDAGVSLSDPVLVVDWVENPGAIAFPAVAANDGRLYFSSSIQGAGDAGWSWTGRGGPG